MCSVNFGVDTGTIWKTLPFREPILWRHISWDRRSPDPDQKQRCPWGWLYYRRVKTRETFWRPMNHTIRLHLKSICSEKADSDAPVCARFETRPSSRFKKLCDLAGIAPQRSMKIGEQQPWIRKDLRKTCATFYDEHVPESSVEILGDSAVGIACRHYVPEELFVQLRFALSIHAILSPVHWRHSFNREKLKC